MPAPTSPEPAPQPTPGPPTLVLIKKRDKVILLAVLLAIPTLLCGTCAWDSRTDSRKYPPVNELNITYRGGDLEDDLLPRYQLTLTCATTHLRYGEWEDFGPSGWLAVRFDTSPPCLARFLRDNRLELSGSPDPTRLVPRPMDRVPEDWGWHILPTNDTYGRDGDPVRITASVDHSGARPVVYVFSSYLF